MSRLIFQAKILLNTATVTSVPGEWLASITFSDNEGVFAPSHVVVSDVLVIDTAQWEPGTLTRYVITEVVNSSWTGEMTVRIQYEIDNDNRSPNPDLSYSLGSTGIVTRPSPNLGLLPVPSPQAQLMSDRFSFYINNYNLTTILDTNGAGGTAPVSEIVTAQELPIRFDGTAELPDAPSGDFIFNTAILHMWDGSILESMGARPITIAGKHYVELPAGDLAIHQDFIISITVSYLFNK